MKYFDLFEKWGLKKLKLNLNFLSAEFEPTTEDKDAAWEMYVELITRVVTQRLDPEDGDEKSALDSIYSLFGSTRTILKGKGRQSVAFTKIAVVVFFTAKWHKIGLAGGFKDPETCRIFRAELEALQDDLRKYAALLADLAEVEDITDLVRTDLEMPA